jgi:hypothetical protein
MPLILIGLHAWTWTAIATVTAMVGGFGLNKGAYMLQARRLARAYEEGGQTALRKQIFEEGLASSSEHCDYVMNDFLAALAPSTVVSSSTTTTTAKAS